MDTDREHPHPYRPLFAEVPDLTTGAPAVRRWPPERLWPVERELARIKRDRARSAGVPSPAADEDDEDALFAALLG